MSPAFLYFRSVALIDNAVFYGTGLFNVTVPTSVTYIGPVGTPSILFD